MEYDPAEPAPTAATRGIKHNTWRMVYAPQGQKRPQRSMASESTDLWQKAERLLAEGRPEAKLRYRALLTDLGMAPLAHLRLSLIASTEGGQRDAVAHALAANACKPRNPDVLTMICKRLLTLGETRAAIDCALSPPILRSGNARALAELGKLMSDHALPEVSLQLIQQARAAGLDSPAIRYLIGLSQMYMGDASAEDSLNASLEADPDFAPAALALSKLRRQSKECNHVDQLRAAIGRLGKDHAEAALLHYALFKELDDLGHHDEAWHALDTGMRLRRRRIRYDAQAEAALYEYLENIDWRSPSPATDVRGPTPIFIVGLPRTGTSLLERMLGAHPDVRDAGELRDLAYQLRWVCDLAGRPELDLPLAQRARDIDWSVLAKRYVEHTGWRADGRRFYTDKFPGNFVNIGYIACALPHAKIVHVTRDPMDTCFSNLKEFFAAAFLYSYDQIEMAEHFRRYRRLMRRWQNAFPDSILDVRYEYLVADPEDALARVLDFCGLHRLPGLARRTDRKGVVATASAMQVREPIHERSIGQWRVYEKYLQPLSDAISDIA